MHSCIKTAALTALILMAHSVNAGQVTNLTTFTAGTPAKAAEVNANFNAVKTAVDDNNNQLGNHETRIQAVEKAAGTLIDRLKDNIEIVEVPPGTSTGYVGFADIIVDYIPPVDAQAFVQTRCSFDGDSAGQTLQHRVAYSTSAGIFVGDQFYLGSTTPAANISVQDVNSDYFDLTAGVKYNFGVYFEEGDQATTPPTFPTPTPKGGTYKDFCSAVVMIFRR